MKITWHRIEDGPPPEQDTPYKSYLVWWAFFDSGYGGVPEVVQFDGLEFSAPRQWFFDQAMHHITHWAEIPAPEGCDKMRERMNWGTPITDEEIFPIIGGE